MKEPKRTLLAATGLAAVVFAAVGVSGDGELRLSSALQADKLAVEAGQGAAEVTRQPTPSRNRADTELAEAADASADVRERSGNLDALPIPCQSLPKRFSQVDH